jgi:hypothetical protein
MADAVEYVQEAPGFGQCEVFRQDIVYPHRRVLIPTDDAHRHRQLLQPLPQPEASHGAAATQRPLDGVARDIGLERLAKLLWDMWSIRRHIFCTPPTGELLPNLLLPVLGQAAASQRRGIQQDQGLHELGMVQRELGDRRPTHRVAYQGKIPQAQRLRCSEEVPGERLHRVIRFCSRALRVASPPVAEGQRTETGRVQGLLDETPDTAGER